MRLIDADALAEEIKKNMENGFPANENLSLYAISCIAHAPTVCDIEQIRAEIKHLLNRPSLTHVVGYDKGFVDGIDKVLQIIDKYNAESEE